MARDLRVVGVDLFAGAGGMSLGARQAGVEVALAVEKDPHAARTYAHNHATTRLIAADIATVPSVPVRKRGRLSILFGGPPCHGYSTSNQRTRTAANPSNWLFREFLRLAREWRPNWVVFENVKGFVDTAGGMFRDTLVGELASLGYTGSSWVLRACDYGVPQERSRFLVVASRHGIVLGPPAPTTRRPVTVRQALADLPMLCNGAAEDFMPYRCRPRTRYAQTMRNGEERSGNHLVTRSAPHVIVRYGHIPQGGNWEDIPERLMRTHSDRTRCHTGVYRRLREDRPSVVIGNFRKNMLIHPWENRGLSVREAARLQSFPDSYEFLGSIGFQQQQVADAVPPLLARAVFEHLLSAAR